MRCQAGTYIRKLCHDFGKKLGVGAHMAQLRRTGAGPLNEEDHLVTLNDLADAYHFWKEEGNDSLLRYCIQPIEVGVRHLRKVWIFDSAIESLSHGRDLGAPGVSMLNNFKKGELVAVMSLKGELVAVGQALMSAVAINTERKGLAVAVKKVFWQGAQ